MNPSYFLAFLYACTAIVAAQGMGMALYGMGVGNTREREGTPLRIPPLLQLFFAQALGWGAGIGLLAVLAVAHIMVPATVALTWAAAAMAGYIWCARRGWGMSCAKSKGQRRRWQESLLLAAAFCLLMLKASHAPGYWDDASYHLPMARLFMRHHGLAVDEYLRFPYFPANMQLLMAAGLQLSGPVLAQMLATLPVFVTLIGLMGCAQWMLGSAVWGVFASLAYATTQPVLETLGFAYVDYGLAMFCLAALLAAAVWYERGDVGDRRWLLLAAVFAGVAGGIKFAGLVFAAMLGLAILVLARRLRPALWFGAVCAATAGGWYLRSYWFSGDPIHPAGGAIFGYHLWNAEDLISQYMEQGRHGLEKTWTRFFDAFAHAKARIVWLGLASVLFLRVLPRAMVLLWAVLVMYCLFWFYVTQVSRYLVLVLPVACLLAVATLNRVWRATELGADMPQALKRALGSVAAWVALAIPGGMLLTQWFAAPPFQAQLASQPAHVLASKANAMAPQYGTRLLNIGFENAAFYYHGQFMGDWFGKARFPAFTYFRNHRWYMRPASEVSQSMRERGVALLLVHRGEFDFDPAEYARYFDLLLASGPGYLYAAKPAITEQ